MKTIAEINAIKDKMKAEAAAMESGKALTTKIVVGMATCGIAAGAKPVFDAMNDEVAKRNLLNVEVTFAGCLGMCKLEPIVEVYVPGQHKVTYIRVDADKAREIIAEHIVGGKICTEYLVTE